MRIEIDIIPHNEHRYPTVGDWWLEGQTLHIRATDDGTTTQLMSWCIVLHETIEAVICYLQGVTTEQVDAFDKVYGDEPNELGDDLSAPYHTAHVCASIAERAIALCLGVNWNLYTQWIEGL